MHALCCIQVCAYAYVQMCAYVCMHACTQASMHAYMHPCLWEGHRRKLALGVKRARHAQLGIEVRHDVLHGAVHLLGHVLEVDKHCLL